MKKIGVDYRGHEIAYDEVYEQWFLKIVDEELVCDKLSGLKHYIDNIIDGEDDIVIPTYVINTNGALCKGSINIKRIGDYSGIIEVSDVVNLSESTLCGNYRDFLKNLYQLNDDNLVFLKEIEKNLTEIKKLRYMNSKLEEKLSTFEFLKKGHRNKY